MTRASALALVAGLLAAAAVVDLAAIAAAVATRRAAAANDPAPLTRVRRLVRLAAVLGRQAGLALVPPRISPGASPPPACRPASACTTSWPSRSGARWRQA